MIFIILIITEIIFLLGIAEVLAGYILHFGQKKPRGIKIIIFGSACMIIGFFLKIVLSAVMLLPGVKPVAKANQPPSIIENIEKIVSVPLNKTNIEEKDIAKIKEIAQLFGITLDKFEKQDSYLEIEGIAEKASTFFAFSQDLEKYNIIVKTQQMHKIEGEKIKFIAKCYLKKFKQINF